MQINPQFHHPSTILVSGCTGSGKTHWIMRFLSNLNELMDHPIERVLYCYGELNDYVMELERKRVLGNGVHVETRRGVVPEEELRKLASEGNLLVVLDDLILGMDTHYLDTLFTRGSHNWGITIVCVTQHLFSKELRTARANSHYIVLLRNPSGLLQIRNLATQLFPQKGAFFMEAYHDATAKPYSYLLIDMHPETEQDLRLKTRIFPDELTIVYKAKST